jgi:hypothetical protein
MQALDIITTEAESSALGDNKKEVLDALDFVSKELCLEKVTTYCRHSLDAMMSTRLGMKVKATDAQWQQVSDSIYDDDQAWSYIDEAIARAEDELINPLVDEMGKPEPSPKFKAWDYVHHVKNKNKDLESRLHIFGTVIKQENNNVWLTDDNDTCEIIRVFEEDLEMAESPRYGWNYSYYVGETGLASRYQKKATTWLALYPHSTSDEEAIRWRSYYRKAVDNDYPILREKVGTDHHHYYIKELGVFCSENYS